MGKNVDFGNSIIRDCGDGFYVQDGNVRLIFTKHWEYVGWYVFKKARA